MVNTSFTPVRFGYEKTKQGMVFNDALTIKKTDPAYNSIKNVFPNAKQDQNNKQKLIELYTATVLQGLIKLAQTKPKLAQKLRSSFTFDSEKHMEIYNLELSKKRVEHSLIEDCKNDINESVSETNLNIDSIKNNTPETMFITILETIINQLLNTNVSFEKPLNKIEALMETLKSVKSSPLVSTEVEDAMSSIGSNVNNGFNYYLQNINK